MNNSAFSDAANIFENSQKAGVEQYQERFVLFLDILGFKKMVEDIDKPKEQEKAFKKIIKAHADVFSAFQSFSKIYSDFNKDLDIQLAYISDSIVISCLPYENNQSWGALFIISAAFVYSRSLLKSKILVRGAIVKNRLFHKGNIVFGRALNDAYALERDISIYPRIIVERSIASIWNEEPHDWSKDILVNDDDDGWHRINLLMNKDYGIFKLDELSVKSWLKEELSILKKDTPSREKESAKINWLISKLDKGSISKGT